MQELDAGEELMGLVVEAVDHGVESVRELAGDPFIPFVLTHGEGDDRQLQRFAATDMHQALSGAHAHLRQAGGLVRAALAYDGYVTVDGQRGDAVFVKAQERGREHSLLFAQRYRPASDTDQFATSGSVVFVGHGEPLF